MTEYYAKHQAERKAYQKEYYKKRRAREKALLARKSVMEDVTKLSKLIEKRKLNFNSYWGID